MSNRAELLRAHVRGSDAAPQIGVDDCGPWVAKWIETACGRRVNFPKYATAAEGYALADKAGGLVRLISPLLAAVGLWETAMPALGDVGVVKLSKRDVPVIFLDRGYAVMRCEGPGVHMMRPNSIEKAWAIP